MEYYKKRVGVYKNLCLYNFDNIGFVDTKEKWFVNRDVCKSIFRDYNNSSIG